MEIALSILAGWASGMGGFILGWYLTNEKWKAELRSFRFQLRGRYSRC